MFAQIALAEHAGDFSPSTLQQIASTTAITRGLDPERFTRTLKCESEWHPTIQSRHITRKGTRERSFGVAQINLDAHPYVSLEQAQDPMWSIEWAATQWEKGNAKWWTCYKLDLVKFPLSTPSS